MIYEAEDFSVEIYTDAVKDIMLYVEVESTDGIESSEKIISRETVKQMIRDLELILEKTG